MYAWICASKKEEVKKEEEAEENLEKRKKKGEIEEKAKKRGRWGRGKSAGVEKDARGARGMGEEWRERERESVALRN